jgi:UDP-N-acetyl-D-glucosamine/UDP-N-acetyl-D-galactosamine dehydrogenase
VNDVTIGIIGLGYVGLPLAAAFGRKYETIGFDVSTERISELNSQKDRTGEVSPQELREAGRLTCTADADDLRKVTDFIVTVPTPVDSFNNPDLRHVERATETVAAYLKKGDIVIYESTVYPGVTEEFCVPILERLSGLRYNRDFFCGYSPERINPGDREHRLTTITKVISASNQVALDRMELLYGAIVEAGTYRAPSIKVAEAAKVIENAQRDINIAFVNELAKVFRLLDIDTNDVLEAAGTKWNFLPFRPGLVGGHCIGVDPYYLANRAVQVGYTPEVILSGRRINDSMGRYVAGRVLKLLVHAGVTIRGSRVLILGFTFKENCPDIRNTRVIDIYRELKEYAIDVSVWDPHADPGEVTAEYGIELVDEQSAAERVFDAVVVAVAHDQFRAVDLRARFGHDCVIYDVKGMFPQSEVDERL